MCIVRVKMDPDMRLTEIIDPVHYALKSKWITEKH